MMAYVDGPKGLLWSHPIIPGQLYEIAVRGVTTAYDIRLTTEEVGTLCTFLDQMLPVNDTMPTALPGERRQRLSDRELETVARIKGALFCVAHG